MNFGSSRQARAIGCKSPLFCTACQPVATCSLLFPPNVDMGNSAAQSWQSAGSSYCCLSNHTRRCWGWSSTASATATAAASRVVDIPTMHA
eukprot:2488353-Amphidinium_carterae.1